MKHYSVLMVVALGIQESRRSTLSPVPEPAALAQARQSVRALFGSESRPHGRAARRAMAERFLAHAEGNDDPLLQYALLTEAKDLAIAAVDVACASRVIDAVARRFALDVLVLRAETLKALSLEPEAPAVELCSAWSSLADQALAADAYDLADESARRAATHAERAGAATLAWAAAQATRTGATLAAYRPVHECFRRAVAGQGTRSENHVVGSFLCFVRGDFARGLPLLATSDAGELVDLAAADLQPDKTAEQRLGLAARWESAAGPEGSTRAAHVRGRALFWYRSAVPLASGLLRLRAQKRVDELTEQIETAPTRSRVRFTSPDALRYVVTTGDWRLEGSRLVGVSHQDDGACTLATFFASIDEVVVRAAIVPPSTQNLRIVCGAHLALFNWEMAAENHFYFGRENVGVTRPHALQPGKLHEIVFRQTAAGVDVLIDGNKHQTLPGKLRGTVTVKPSVGSTISIKEIHVTGVDVPSVPVDGPFFGEPFQGGR
jgi:hypothetical protein